MKIYTYSPLAALVSVLALSSATGIQQGHIRELPDVIHLPLVSVEVPLGNIGDTEALFLITTAAQYEQLFGEKASGIDFKTQWGFLYAAGFEPTDGYEALVRDITYTPNVQSLVISTELLTPGMNCEVAQHVTKPYMLVKFPQPPGAVGVVRVSKSTEAVECTGGN